MNTNQKLAKLAKQIRSYKTYNYSLDTLIAKFNLPAETVKKVDAIIRNREGNRPYTFDVSHTKNFKHSLEENVDMLAKCLPSTGYSMGEMKTLTIDMGQWCIIGSYNNCDTYAKSCSYKPTWGSVYATLPREFIKAVNIGGLITLRIGKERGGICKCKWVEFKTEGRKQYFELTGYEIKSGYIVGDYHCSTYKEAVDHKRRYENIVKQRQESIIDKQGLTAIGRKNLRRKFNFADSLAAGNCKPGTAAFCRIIGVSENVTMTGKKLLDVTIRKASHLLTYVLRMLNKKY